MYDCFKAVRLTYPIQTLIIGEGVKLFFHKSLVLSLLKFICENVNVICENICNWDSTFSVFLNLNVENQKLN